MADLDVVESAWFMYKPKENANLTHNSGYMLTLVLELKFLDVPVTKIY